MEPFSRPSRTCSSYSGVFFGAVSVTRQAKRRDIAVSTHAHWSGERRLLACSIRQLAECAAFNSPVIFNACSRQAAANYRPAACAPQKGSLLATLNGTRVPLPCVAMTLLDKLERRFGFLAIPRLIRIVIGFTALVYFLMYLNHGFESFLDLDPARIRHGEIWRLVTYIFIPRGIGASGICNRSGSFWPSGFSGLLARASNERGVLSS